MIVNEYISTSCRGLIKIAILYRPVSSGLPSVTSHLTLPGFEHPTWSAHPHPNFCWVPPPPGHHRSTVMTQSAVTDWVTTIKSVCSCRNLGSKIDTRSQMQYIFIFLLIPLKSSVSTLCNRPIYDKQHLYWYARSQCRGLLPGHVSTGH